MVPDDVMQVDLLFGADVLPDSELFPEPHRGARLQVREGTGVGDWG